ncbi:hypothetical protein BH23GEM6_BH23GEM6_08420 [soil metagenome]
MTESLVVIRTFRTVGDADGAQAELLTAGIHALVYTEDVRSPDTSGEHVVLAVHSRDAQIAELVLTPHPRPS